MLPLFQLKLLLCCRVYEGHISLEDTLRLLTHLSIVLTLINEGSDIIEKHDCIKDGLLLYLHNESAISLAVRRDTDATQARRSPGYEIPSTLP